MKVMIAINLISEKMKLSTMLLIAAIIVIALVFTLYFFLGPTTTMHSLAIRVDNANKTIHTSKEPIIVSSDGVDIVVYATDAGIVEYDILTDVKTVINTTPTNDIKGLAYVDNGFMMLNKAGAFIRLSDDTLLTMGGEALYDTVGGYYQKVDGVEASTGGWDYVNGSYGLVKLIII